MDEIDDLKDFGLAVLSLLVASAEAQEADTVDPVISELSTLCTAVPPCGLFQSWDVECSSRPAAALILDNTYRHDSDELTVDGGCVIATASSSKAAAVGPSKLIGSAGGYWQSSADARLSWLKIRLERPTFLLYAELEWKWEATVSLTVCL